MVAGQQLEEISSAYFEGGGEEENGLLHDSDILDMDKAELLLGRDIDIFSSSEAEDVPADSVTTRFSTKKFPNNIFKYFNQVQQTFECLQRGSRKCVLIRIK